VGTAVKWQRGTALLATCALVSTLLILTDLAPARAVTPVMLDSRPLAEGPTAHSWPRVSGPWLVWQEGPPNADASLSEPNTDIFVRDLRSGVSRALTTSHRAAHPAISGNLVVWTEVTPNGRDIVGVDLSSGQPLTVTSAPGAQDFADIDGSLVVWLDARDARTDIYGVDLRDGHEFPVAVGPAPRYHARVSAGRVVWQEGRTRPTRPDIFLLDLASGVERQISTSHLAAQPSLSGDWVVFADGFSNAPSIMAFNLQTAELRKLSSAADGARANPVVNGPLVVWQDQREDDWDIYAYDLLSSQEWALVYDDDNQTQPATDGTTMVWTDDSGRTTSIRGAELQP
jgi:beta propeller repeat protein